MQSGKGKGQKFLWQAIPSMAICVAALLQVQVPSLRAGAVLYSRRGAQQVTCITGLPVASAAASQQCFTLVSQYWVKSQGWAGCLKK